VDEDLVYPDVVRVQIADRQVKRPKVLHPHSDTSDLDPCAVAGYDLITCAQIDGIDPPAASTTVRHPERMAIRRIDGGAICEPDGDHRVGATVADQVDDRTRPPFASLGVGRHDLVAELDALNRLLGAVGHENESVAGEAVCADPGCGFCGNTVALSAAAVDSKG
jgi:hypothetical protein